MYPEDRVLVGVMPDPQDFEIAMTRQWYRVPVSRAPAGIQAEYLAFYFTGKFAPEMRWGIYYYARRTGHEIMRRIDLLPDQPLHPRAQDTYYMVQLGPLREKQPPILSRRWRRITFINTTWDRFVKATEINDLFRSETEFVDRLYDALKERGIQPERDVPVGKEHPGATVELAIPCNRGLLMLTMGDPCAPGVLKLEGSSTRDLRRIESAIQQNGGPRMIDAPL